MNRRPRRLIDAHKMEQCMVFCRTNHDCNQLEVGPRSPRSSFVRSHLSPFDTSIDRLGWDVSSVLEFSYSLYLLLRFTNDHRIFSPRAFLLVKTQHYSFLPPSKRPSAFPPHPLTLSTPHTHSDSSTPSAAARHSGAKWRRARRTRTRVWSWRGSGRQVREKFKFPFI